MRSLLTLSLVTASAVLLTACGGGSSDSSTPLPIVATTQTVSIQFAAQANGKDAQCGAVNEIANLGSTNKTAEIQDLRFYVSALELVNDKGQAVAVTLDKNTNQDFGVALLDFENATGACAGGDAKTNTVITGKIPTGTYTGIKFTLGVPDTVVDTSGNTIILNHSNTTAITAPLDVAAMAWSWQGGRKFAKIEFKTTGGVTNQKIVLDVPALVAQSDISVNQNSAIGCMSGTTDKECPAVFDTLGLDLLTGKVSTSKTQTVFKVINK